MIDKFVFDWRYFTPEDLLLADRSINEDLIVGFIPFMMNGKHFIIDLHHEFFSARERCFPVDVFASNEKNEHVEWLFTDRSILTATNYKRFRTRVTNAVLQRLKAATTVKTVASTT